MKNISLFMISTVLSFSIAQQARTTEVIEQEDMREGGKKATTIPLYPESEELMISMLDQNKVYKKAEASTSTAPQSDVLSAIKEHSAQYIKDLKEGYKQVEETESPIKRQEMVEAIQQKNNPFSSFYY